MRNDFLPFCKPSISEEEITAVADVLRSGWITTGKYNAELENNFREYTGCANAVALASATAGMHILLKALGIGPGDEVITPSLTWVSTANMIVLAGAIPVFADVDRDTLLLTPEAFEKCITEKTKAVVPVHYAGAPVDLDAINAIADKDNIFVIQDAAHAVGTEYKGKHVGSDGTAIFSFHPIKNMTTGEGGMFVTGNDELGTKIRQLKFHGLGVDAFDRQTQGRAPQAEVLEPGYKYNLTDIAACLGVHQLAKLDAINSRRRELTELYLEKLAGIDELTPLKDPNYPHLHARHLMIVRLDIEKAGMGRDDFMAALKAKNIGAGLHFRAIHSQKYYRENLPVATGTLPNTEWNSERIMSLPLFPDMTIEDLNDVIGAIKETLKK